MAKEADEAADAAAPENDGSKSRRRRKTPRGASAEREAAARLEALEARIAELEAEATDRSDRALRTLAEFDNFRRRSHREREAALALGMAEVLRELLEVADNFDRALEHAGDDVPESFLEGLGLVVRGVHDLLDRNGVSRMDAEGKPFDPEYHEALTRTPVEGAAPNTIVQVVQPGYLLQGRVLRPAKVIVAAPMPSVVDSPASRDGEDA